LTGWRVKKSFKAKDGAKSTATARMRINLIRHSRVDQPVSIGGKEVVRMWRGWFNATYIQTVLGYHWCEKSCAFFMSIPIAMLPSDAF
jgi:hypothetical protein